MLDFFCVAAADFAGRTGSCCRLLAGAGRLRVHRRAGTAAGTDSRCGLVAKERYFLLAFENERAFRAVDDFAVSAESVAVNGGVLNGDAVSGLDVVFGIVARGRVFKLTNNVVFRFAVVVKNRAIAGGDNAQRMLFDAAVHGGNEDAGCVELMRAEFNHQTAASALPQTPANEFFARRAVVRRAVAQNEVVSLIAVLRRVDDFVLQTHSRLFHFNAGFFNRRTASRFQRVFGIVVNRSKLFRLRVVRLEVFRHGLLPGVSAGHVASMPLSANVVQVAQQSALNRVHRFFVKNVVVTLMSGRQMDFRQLRRLRHFFTFKNRVRHELFCQDVQALFHGSNRRRRVKVQRQSDNDRFNAQRLGVFEQVFVIFVNLDVLTSLVFGLPAVNRHQALASRQGGVGIVVAVERAPLVVRSDVCNGDNLNVFRIDSSQKDVAFVACS